MGQLWEEHWVVREEEDVKEEKGLLAEKGTKQRAEQSMTGREWRDNLTQKSLDPTVKPGLGP